MKITELPYYVKFTFMSTDGTCMSTADYEMLKLIKNADSRERIWSIEVGKRVFFEPNDDVVYRFTGISVDHLFEDTDEMRVGLDLEDCASMQGQSNVNAGQEVQR